MSEFHALDRTVLFFSFLSFFFLKKNIYIIVIALSGGLMGWGPSVGQRGGLRGVGFLPPLHQQRVGGILNFLDLDLFVVHSHGGQGTGHLLLRAGGAQSHQQSPPRVPKAAEIKWPL